MRTYAVTFFVLAFGWLQARAQNQTPAATQNQGRSQTQNHTAAATNSASQHGQSSSSLQSAQARESEDAADLLDATDQARNAVLDSDKQDALEHVNHALEKAQQIMQQKPGRFVPIYDELSRYSVIEPVMQSRAQQTLPNAAQPSSGQSSTAPNASVAPHASVAPNDERPYGVQEVVGGFTSVDLDVKAADEHLRAARQALQNGDFAAADAALKAVQDGVDIASISSDLPLVRARENLMLARESVERGDNRETRAALKDASAALKEYARMGGSHSSQANSLCSQIDSTASAAPHQANSASQIENWWEQVATWTRRS